MSITAIAILVTILIILAIVGGVALWYYVLRKPNKSNNSNAQADEVIRLMAVERLKGSNPFGYETNEEVAKRLNAITDKETFKALNVDEKPYTHEQWDELSKKDNADELIDNRNKIEVKLCFLYSLDGEINPETEAFLVRKF